MLDIHNAQPGDKLSAQQIAEIYAGYVMCSGTDKGLWRIIGLLLGHIQHLDMALTKPSTCYGGD